MNHVCFVPSSMDMKVLELRPQSSATLDIGLLAEKHLLGMESCSELCLGSDGDEDLYRCHIVGC